MKRKKISRLNEAILEIVDDLRGGAIKEETATKITLRVLGDRKDIKADVKDLKADKHHGKAG